MRTITCLILSAAMAFGAGEGLRVEGPRIGFVAQEGQVRPVLGIPGSAWTGPPAWSADHLRDLAFSPEGSWAVALDAVAKQPVIVRDLAGAPVVQPFVELTGATRLALSPSGTAAAVLYGGHEKLVVASGLPGAPQLWEFDLAGLGVEWLRLAVSDGGEAVLATILDNGQYWVAGIRREGGFRKLYAAGGGAAAAFLPGKVAAVLADTEKSLVYVLPGLESAPRLIATGQDGVRRPVEVAASRDGRRAVVVHEGGASATVLGLEDTVAAQVECGCKMESVQRMNGNALFRLTDAGTGTIWLLDADSAPPGVLFVPAGGAR